VVNEKSAPRKRLATSVRRRESVNPRPATGPTKEDRPLNTAFPIVGIGVSAGGLEAFTQLLGALPVDTGKAFVQVRHLVPQHERRLTSLVSLTTKLPIHEARAGRRLAANHGYVLLPNTKLKRRVARRRRLPTIESLAQDSQKAKLILLSIEEVAR